MAQVDKTESTTTTGGTAASACGCAAAGLPPGGPVAAVNYLLPLTPGGQTFPDLKILIPAMPPDDPGLPPPCTPQTTPLLPGGTPPVPTLPGVGPSLADCEFVVGSKPNPTPSFGSTTAGAGLGETASVGIGYSARLPAVAPGGYTPTPVNPIPGYTNYTGTLTLRAGTIVSKSP